MNNIRLMKWGDDLAGIFPDNWNRGIVEDSDTGKWHRIEYIDSEMNPDSPYYGESFLYLDGEFEKRFSEVTPIIPGYFENDAAKLDYLKKRFGGDLEDAFSTEEMILHFDQDCQINITYDFKILIRNYPFNYIIDQDNINEKIIMFENLQLLLEVLNECSN